MTAMTHWNQVRKMGASRVSLPLLNKDLLINTKEMDTNLWAFESQSFTTLHAITLLLLLPVQGDDGKDLKVLFHERIFTGG